MPDLDWLGPRTLHKALRLPNTWLAQAYFDLSFTGVDNLPSSGPVVVAANHFSHLDPPIIAAVLRRYTRFVAVDELFGRSRAFDMMMKYFGAIPIDRDGYPVHAMRSAIEVLRGGQPIGVFPEGRRVERWGVDPPKRGAAWLAWMTGAPLVPVTIYGTKDSLSPGQRGFKRTAVHLWIDEPLWWHAYAEYIDPLGAMMRDWYEIVDAHLAPWEAIADD